MKISVIVPTYKPQAYLWECLDSIYNQIFPKADYELVLVLNGCNEPYDAQITEWLSKHSDLRVQFFQTDAGGVSNARNIALDNARGEYITFIDDDDFISSLYLKELYEKANPDTVSLCYPYAFKDGHIEKQLSYRVTKAYDYCYKHKCKKLSSMVRKYFSGPCMKLIPMSFIHDRRYDVRFKNGEDSIYMFLISDRLKKVSFTSRNAIYYRRIRNNSASMNKKPIMSVVKNQVNMIKAYSFIYFQRPFSYKFVFFLTRILGAIHTIISRLVNQYY